MSQNILDHLETTPQWPRKASRIKRCVAWGIDVSLVVLVVILFVPNLQEQVVYVLIAWVLYGVVFEAVLLQTIGKLVLKLKIVATDDSRPSIISLLLKNVLKLVYLLLLPLVSPILLLEGLGSKGQVYKSIAGGFGLDKFTGTKIIETAPLS